MKSLGGTVLHVDLSSGKIEKKPIEEDLRAEYVGGRGINVRLLFNETAAGIDPLSPENRLIIGTGLFSGTSAPCAARFNVTTKSPLTGIVGDANGGGHFGPALRRLSATAAERGNGKGWNLFRLLQPQKTNQVR